MKRAIITREKLKYLKCGIHAERIKNTVSAMLPIVEAMADNPREFGNEI